MPAMILCLCLATCVSIAMADEPYWPRFTGPDGTNVSKDQGLLNSWPEGGPELVWKTNGIGDGFATVTLADGRIFTAGNIDDKMMVTAMDLDGKILWQKPNGAAYKRSYAGARGTPTIDGDRVYHESPTGQVTCFNAADGKEIWTKNILKDFGAKNITWALAESVLVDGDHLIVTPGGPQTAVVALDKKTGDVVWKSGPSVNEGGKADLANYATATLAKFGKTRIILTMSQKALIGVNADTGKLLFRFPHETKYFINATKPVYHDGQICISSGYGTIGTVMLKLKGQGDKISVEKIGVSEDLDNQHGGLVLYDGYIYGSSHKFNDGAWICLNWKNGKTMYTEKGIGQGSLTVADGKLYLFAEKRRKVALVKATPKGYEEISQFTLPNLGEGTTWAYPVVVGGRLYLRHGDYLFAYDVRGK